MGASKGTHGSDHTGLSALLSGQKCILILEFSLILEEVEKFLEDREFAPSQVSAVETFIILDYSLSEVSRAKQRLTLKIPCMILKLPKVKVQGLGNQV